MNTKIMIYELGETFTNCLYDCTLRPPHTSSKGQEPSPSQPLLRKSLLWGGIAHKEYDVG